jgi:hypothetical protein
MTVKLTLRSTAGRSCGALSSGPDVVTASSAVVDASLTLPDSEP